MIPVETPCAPDGPSHRPHLLVALVPVVFLIVSLWLALVQFRELELTSHVPLVLATAVAAVVAWRLGLTWRETEAGIIHGIGLATQAVLILLVIGIMAATWIQAGVVPAMVAYGFDLLSPRIFLPAACVICAFVSLASGSSWSTMATVGIALVGVGEGLGIPRPMVAGAVISGAYFGDKMSPLSDTTNLAPAMAGSDLFDHIRHMVYTTGPSLLVAVIGFAVLGYGYAGAADLSRVESLRGAIASSYVLHPALLLPPALILVAVVLRIPALPALFGGTVLGALLGVLIQGAGVAQVLQAAYAGVKVASGNAFVDDLLSRGGLASMFSTVALILCALAFGGVMERAGMLEAIAAAVLRAARGPGSLIAATLGTCIGMNGLACDQYLAIVVPGRMFREAYVQRGLAPKNLSRALEDAGTLTSVLFPWNSCGAFVIATLGLSPWTYVPFCFLNLVNPLISAVYGFTGVTIVPLAAQQDGGSAAKRVFPRCRDAA